ncbi:origin recognition complex subunit 2 [Sugiyamaella lignohabitans]|uniref:Origin recognition complex subunit 2 n=1 Tax=Sugiyamaella lignohabitans TaxID=796027 RepID=A0A167C9V5_9ASCO|nr:origin recognition complex subunit 2 [Sugiyamaella lignohabitans]ANB11412.1 origin recognition complex subunit 2 [Sugiyamaella lignohabitans]
MSEEPQTPRKRRSAAFKGNYADIAGGGGDVADNEEDFDVAMNGDGDDDNEDDNDNEADEEDEDDLDVKRTPSKVARTGSRTTPRKKNVKKASSNGSRGVSTPRSTAPLFPRTNTDLDRSARKRATRLLMDRLLLSENMDDEDILDADDQKIAEKIIRESRGETITPSVSPSKTINRTDSKDDRFEIPLTFDADDEEAGRGPQTALFIEGPEGYFDQHKLREKISTTPFSRAPRIEYQEFVDSVRESTAIHEDARAYLSTLYRAMFPQWRFELMQNFSILFYGVGSKRNLIMDFVCTSIDPEIPVLVANGYNPATTLKEILNTAVTVLVKDEAIRSSFPRQPTELVEALLTHLAKPETDQSNQLLIVVHNLDGEALRADRWQAILARLVSAKQISLVASVDHIHAPILFDAARLSQYNFLWHDLTTFELYLTETSFEDPLALGSDRSAVSSKGAKFVLSSLTNNARRLYQELICYQIAVMSEVLAPDDVNTSGTAQHGIEFKELYKQCAEQLIVSNELNFRTMLSEFFDHKMAARTKDQTGQEIIYVPFTKDAIEGILEELVV